MPTFDKGQEPLFAREGLFRQKLNQLRTTGNVGQQRNVPMDNQARLKELEKGSYLHNAKENFVKNDPQHAERVALLDSTTDLYNRNTIEKAIKEEWKRAKRYKHNLGLLVISVDLLDNAIKSHGQAAGDSILQGVANFLMSQIRDVDVPGRYDTNAFLILCPETDAKGVGVLAERIKNKIMLTRVSDIGQNWHVTVSQGIAGFPGTSQRAEELINEALMASNKAKQNGGNQIVIACAQEQEQA